MPAKRMRVTELGTLPVKTLHHTAGFISFQWLRAVFIVDPKGLDGPAGRLLVIIGVQINPEDEPLVGTGPAALVLIIQNRKNEVAQRIGNESVAVGFDALNDVRMVLDDQASPRVDKPPGKLDTPGSRMAAELEIRVK